MAATDTAHIIQSLIANLAIAVAKGVATFFTGSGAMLAMKVRMRPDLLSEELCEAINRFEQSVRERRLEVRWCFIEPDVRR